MTRLAPTPGRAPGREAGFTLVELLVTMTLSLVVVGAAMTFVLVTQRASGDVSNRVEAQQRGRTAMTQLTQMLRSQVCSPTSAPPIEAASATSVTFYGEERQVAAGTYGNADPAPLRRRLTFVPGADGAPGRIEEDRWLPTGSPVTYADPPLRRTVAEDVAPAAPGEPIFRFYRLTDVAPGTAELAAPGPADLPYVSQVAIRFVASAGPARPSASTSAELRGRVFSRIADTALPNQAVPCT